MLRGLASLAALIALGGGLAACGDDGSGDSDPLEVGKTVLTGLADQDPETCELMNEDGIDQVEGIADEHSCEAALGSDVPLLDTGDYVVTREGLEKGLDDAKLSNEDMLVSLPDGGAIKLSLVEADEEWQAGAYKVTAPKS